MKRVCFPLIAMAVCLAGCYGNSGETASNSPSQPDTTPETAAPLPTPTPAKIQKPATAPKPPSTQHAVPIANNQKPEKSILGPDAPTVTDPAVRKDVEKAAAIDKKARLQALIIPPKGADGWMKSDIAPVFIAQHMDESIAGIKNVQGKITAVIKQPDGSGRANLDVMIRDPKTYKIQFFDFGAQPIVCEVIANGKYKIMQVGPTWEHKIAVDSVLQLPRSPLPSDVTAINLSRSVFQPLFKTNDSWTGMVKRWLAPNSGYTVNVEQRSIPNGMYRINQVRLLVERNAVAAKKLGASKMEIVVDGMHSLPVTIQTSYSDPSGQTWAINWGCHYEAVTGFGSKDFEAPFDVQPAKRKPSRRA